MACTPPFYNGTGGWCGCNCRCCPPPCCDEIVQTWNCGTSQEEIGPLGCDCGGASFRFMEEEPELPEFDNVRIQSEDGQFVFGLDEGGCSIPCETLSIAITTDGCCIELDDITGVMTAVGDGTVTAIHSGGVLNGSCGTLVVLVNGSEDSAVVSDGDSVTITVYANEGMGSVPVCCPCCLASWTCTTPHASMTQHILRTSILIRTSKNKGKAKYRINKPLILQKLKEKIMRERRRKRGF